MDAAHIFRQGLGTIAPHPHPNQAFFPQPRRAPRARHELSDGDSSSIPRVAHTLTACCRCRQRKTRCDPTLPRCLPCERSGAICEYYDATKGFKVNRQYVVDLQNAVKRLEAELSQYTDEDGDHPPTSEEMIRPGGMVRLSGNDETPRYLGPTSGIAMTRLLMAEAKRFTDSNKISDLIPEVRARSQARMQSIQMTGSSTIRKKSYPMVSERPAESLPTRAVVDRLAEIYFRKAQLYWPLLHEKVFQADMEAIYNGDTDPFKNFLLRMVIAVGLQRLDMQYAGLADGYYMASMKYIEEIIRPKDIKTLQCLVLIGQYSLLSPARTPIYYVIGLATRICQQEGLTDEKTITAGYNLDPQTVDLRRRLVWIVAVMESGLSYHMGRPNAFATTNERLNVNFFAAVDDEHITPDGIQAGPPSKRKLITIHFYKMRDFQVEIRRTLYEKKKPEPRDDSHRWFESIERRLQEWLDSTPEEPPWAKSWFTVQFHQLRTLLYRPCPQLPQPSPRAAQFCYDSAAVVITTSHKQMEGAMVDVTWTFLLTLNVCLSTLLWTTSYPEVRQAHARDEVEKLVNTALECLDRCAERWPGTASTSQLYTIFSKACLQSYEGRPGNDPQPAFTFASPPAAGETHSSPESYAQSTPTQPVSYLNPPQFGDVFNSGPESMNTYAFDANFPPPQPTFRSNSIFCNPATDNSSRRFSYFPPDVSYVGDAAPDDPAQACAAADQIANHLPTPPESLAQANFSTASPSTTLSPPGLPVTQPPSVSPVCAPLSVNKNLSPDQKRIITGTPQPAEAQPPYAVPRIPPSIIQQRPLPPTPTTTSDWLSPSQQFISPFNLVSTSNNFFNEAMAGTNGFGDGSVSGLGLHNITAELGAGGAPFGFLPGRQCSLSHSQQLELMNVLETEGVGDMDAFLNGSNNMNERWY